MSKVERRGISDAEDEADLGDPAGMKKRVKEQEEKISALERQLAVNGNEAPALFANSIARYSRKPTCRSKLFGICMFVCYLQFAISEFALVTVACDLGLHRRAIPLGVLRWAS